MLRARTWGSGFVFLSLVIAGCGGSHSETCDRACSGHGTCAVQAGVPRCTCSAGYAGADCESCAPGYTQDATGECTATDGCAAGNPCGDHGSCDSSSGDVVCVCDVGYQGTVCTECYPGYHDDGEGTCVLDEQCLATTCAGHGSCDASTGVVVCTCDEGYAGSNCESCAEGYHVDANLACVADESCAASDPCGDHGTCVDDGGVVACVCDAGYQGTVCNECYPGYHDDGEGACVLDEQCLATTCAGHGSCDDSTGVVACTCDEGYVGGNCESCAEGYHWDADLACAADESCAASDPCGDHGTCVDDGGIVACVCDAGYQGTTCTECYPGYHDSGDGTCVLDDQCLPTSCAGHGECSATGGVVSCACDDGYAGGYCETCDVGYHEAAGVCVVDEVCEADTCSGHGPCIVMAGVAVCFCGTGYAGDACDTCAVGYHEAAGGTCVVDETCQAESCSGHGQCSVIGGVVACSCDVGYAGATCEDCYPGYAVNSLTGLCEIPCNEGPYYIRCDGQCLWGLDPTNCGGCGITCSGVEVCQFDGTVAACVCPLGDDFGSCPGDGCVDFSRDANNCGACGQACTPGTACILGQCQSVDNSCTYPCDPMYSTCCAGWCMPLDIFAMDPMNCGGCGIVCQPGEMCVAGRCQGEDPGCSPPCAPQQAICCEASCIDWMSDTQNCGACGHVCPVGQTCTWGECRCMQTVCDGQCVNTQTDRAHCGACGAACGAGEICASGTCVAGTGTSCDPACDDTQLCCAVSGGPDECVDGSVLGYDPAHCGGCDPCLPGEACWDGVCYCGYGPGDPTFAVCDGVCVSLWTTDDCGACGNACGPLETCLGSDVPGGTRCVCPSEMGDPRYAVCNGVCTNTDGDGQNCGSCGHACNAGEVCVVGQCVAGTGTSCDPACSDTQLCCAVSGGPDECVDGGALGSDPAHCGGCDPCQPGEKCSNGVCAVEETGAQCLDGVDNDLDGLEDCEGPLCQSDPSAICETGVIWCLDSSCTQQCPEQCDGLDNCGIGLPDLLACACVNDAGCDAIAPDYRCWTELASSFLGPSCAPPCQVFGGDQFCQQFDSAWTCRADGSCG